MSRTLDRASTIVGELGSGHAKTRGHAYRELLAMRSEAVDAVVGGARHSSWRVRAGSVALMDHLADHRCLAALEEATADPSSDVRRHAAHALACQQCKPAPLDLDVLGLLLKLASEDRSIRVRRVATASLVLQPPSRRAATVLRMSGQVASDQR